MPQLIDPQAVADGAFFTGSGIDRFASLGGGDTTVALAARFEPGVDAHAEDVRISKLPGIGAFSSGSVTAISKPLEIQRLDQIHDVPLALAAFLAVLGTLALGHLLVTSVTRKRREFAILKSIGFSRRQLTAAVAWQATTVAVIGLCVGAFVGVAAGALTWRALAHHTGIEAGVTTPVLVIVAVGLAALVAANLVSAVPGRAAARTPAARALHDE
jgi:ABC-type antimicrobial peptide transport system permease subunit